MKKGAKIWLWAALILSICTTVMNATESRWLSVGIAAASLAGLCLLLFKQKKIGFYLMCGCNFLSFIVGLYGGLQGGVSVFLSVIMSFIGAALIPAVTFFFICGQWKELK